MFKGNDSLIPNNHRPGYIQDIDMQCCKYPLLTHRLGRRSVGGKFNALPCPVGTYQTRGLPTLCCSVTRFCCYQHQTSQPQQNSYHPSKRQPRCTPRCAGFMHHVSTSRARRRILTVKPAPVCECNHGIMPACWHKTTYNTIQWVAVSGRVARGADWQYAHPYDVK